MGNKGKNAAIIAILLAVIVSAPVAVSFIFRPQSAVVSNGNVSGNYTVDLKQFNTTGNSVISLHSNATISQGNTSMGFFNSSMSFKGYNDFESSKYPGDNIYNGLLFFSFTGAFPKTFHPTSIDISTVAYYNNSAYGYVNIQNSGIYANSSEINNVSTSGGNGGVFNLLNQNNINQGGSYHFNMGSLNSTPGGEVLLFVPNYAIKNNLTVVMKLSVNGLPEPVFDEFSINLVV